MKRVKCVCVCVCCGGGLFASNFAPASTSASMISMLPLAAAKYRDPCRPFVHMAAKTKRKHHRSILCGLNCTHIVLFHERHDVTVAHGHVDQSPTTPIHQFDEIEVTTTIGIFFPHDFAFHCNNFSALDENGLLVSCLLIQGWFGQSAVTVRYNV